MKNRHENTVIADITAPSYLFKDSSSSVYWQKYYTKNEALSSTHLVRV